MGIVCTLEIVYVKCKMLTKIIRKNKGGGGREKRKYERKYLMVREMSQKKRKEDIFKPLL